MMPVVLLVQLVLPVLVVVLAVEVLHAVGVGSPDAAAGSRPEAAFAANKCYAK